jgi:hypothetical protein
MPQSIAWVKTASFLHLSLAEQPYWFLSVFTHGCSMGTNPRWFMPAVLEFVEMSAEHAGNGVTAG